MPFTYADTLKGALRRNGILRGHGDRNGARGLGWASLAVGLTELAAPRQLDRLLGTGQGEHADLFRVLGLREICHGIDILCHDDPAPGIWSRVAGDALDGVLLGIAATKTRRPSGVLAAAAMVLPIVLADLYFAAETPVKNPFS